MANRSQRDIGLDVIRCLALFCVIGVHFFLLNDFYGQIIAGKFMFAAVLVRNAFMICVPLFLLLTGYLVTTADPSKKYFIKLVRIVGIYILASLCCGIFRVAILPNTDDSSMSLTQALLGILSFTTAPYCWYVEMYIGLFLLIPFMNLMYNNLATLRNRRKLLAVLLILTTLPCICNIFNFDSLSWWLQPSSSHTYLKIVPQYWVNFYPVTYFVVGRYLRDYPIKLKKGTYVILIAAVFFLAGAFNYYRSHTAAFVGGQWQSYGSPLIMAQSVLVFSFLASLRYDRVPRFMARIVAKVSDWSFGAYLLSWIFDYSIYLVIFDSAVGIRERVRYCLFVPIIFVASTLLSGVITEFYRVTVGRLVQRVQQKWT